MKRVFIFLFLLSFVFVNAEVNPQDVANIAGEKLSDVAKNSNVYAEVLGENLLKFQEFFIGALEFVSLGFFDIGGEMEFVRFLFSLLLFMFLYSVVGFVFDKFNFSIAFILTLLAFIGMDDGSLRSVFLNYEAMGFVITLILPILILLGFTFRIYQRSYEGESKVSPFYANMFNFGFLVFFGVLFIQHSFSEDGVAAIMRFVSGCVLIGLGIGQVVFYKIFSGLIHTWKIKENRSQKIMEEMKRKATDKIRDAELDN